MDLRHSGNVNHGAHALDSSASGEDLSWSEFPSPPRIPSRRFSFQDQDIEQHRQRMRTHSYNVVDFEHFFRNMTSGDIYNPYDSSTYDTTPDTNKTR